MTFTLLARCPKTGQVGIGIATSMVSASSTMADNAHPFLRLIFSASGIGVTSPTAASYSERSMAQPRPVRDRAYRAAETAAAP